MLLSARLRRLWLTIHLVASVGWIGAVAAYLTLDVAVATRQDPTLLRAAYIGMELISSLAILPLAFASLATGLVLSLGTKWGLVRHYWVIISLILTVFAIVVLLLELVTIRHYADVALDSTTTDDRLRGLGNTLVHSLGGLVVLMVVMVLNVYKPRGLTPYGWRKQNEERAQGSAAGIQDR